MSVHWGERLTAAGREVLRLAAAAAGAGPIGPEHVFGCLAQRGQSVAAKALDLLGCAWRELGVPDLAVRNGWPIAGSLTPAAERLFEHAAKEARALGHHPVNTGHLVLAILAEDAGQLPEGAPLTYARFRATLLEVLALPWVHGYALDGEVLLYLSGDEALVLYGHLLRRRPRERSGGAEHAVLDDLLALLAGPCAQVLAAGEGELFRARIRVQRGRRAPP